MTVSPAAAFAVEADMRTLSLVLLAALFGVIVPGCILSGCTVVASDRDDFANDEESIGTYCVGADVPILLTPQWPWLNQGNLSGASSDESVFTVDAGEEPGTVILHTLAAGDAELVVRHNGDVVDSRRIVVRDPASVKLTLQMQAVEADDIMPRPLAVTPPLRVLDGRAAGLLIHVFDEDEVPLRGLAVTATATGATAEIAAIGVRQMLHVGDVVAEGAVQLDVGQGALLVEIATRPAPLTAIERLVLDDIKEPKLGQHAFVLAHAEDSDGGVLLGAPRWQLEGEDKGLGEGLRYMGAVTWGVPMQLTARIGEHEVLRHIYTDPKSVTAVPVAPQGCATGATAMPVLLLLGLSGRRGVGRRRRA